MKRDMHVVTRAHWLTERFIALIDAFGFYSHMVRYKFSSTAYSYSLCRRLPGRLKLN